MLRNRTRQLDPVERQRKNRETELLILLERCSQIAKDDRILLRNLIKEQSQEVLAVMNGHRRQPDLAELQVELRRLIGNFRSKLNENFEFSKETRRSTTRVTSFQKSSKPTNVRHPQPLQLRLIVDHNTGTIRKTDFEGTMNTACQSELTIFDSRPSESTGKLSFEPDPSVLRNRFEKEVQQEIDREIQRELQDLTIEQVKAEQPEQEPDESLLAENVLHQYRPFEKTVCFSRGLKHFESSYRPISQPSLDESPLKEEPMAEQAIKNQRQSSTSVATSLPDTVNSSLKANAQLWYQQFMQQNNKWRVGDAGEPTSCQPPIMNPQCSSVQSDDPLPTPPPLSQTHKKGLSLNLQCLSSSSPSQQAELFSFRRQRQRQPQQRYGQFYKKLKKELESL